MEDVKKYISDISVLNIYKNYVDIPVVEYSIKIINKKIDRYRYMVVFLYENTSKNKIYNFVDDLIHNKIFHKNHTSTIYNFIEKYYSNNYDFSIAIDNDKYSLYFDLNDELKCLILDNNEYFYKNYKPINYIDENSINISENFGLNLINIPVSKILQVSSNSKIDKDYSYIEKYHYRFLYPINHPIINHKIYWMSIFKNEVTLYFRENIT